jgi:hypothetical protein
MSARILFGSIDKARIYIVSISKNSSRIAFLLAQTMTETQIAQELSMGQFNPILAKL